jgi:hypothetical protein
MGAVLGRPGPGLVRDALAAVAHDFELVAQDDAAQALRAALAGWRVVGATLHRLTEPAVPGPPPGPGVIVVDAPGEAALRRVPAHLRADAEGAGAIALRLAGDRVVSVCTAGAITETLWDVGIDTVPGQRRQGHATAAFGALAAHLAARGRQPVWGAEDDNVASLCLAARLGFAPAGHLAVVKR